MASKFNLKLEIIKGAIWTVGTRWLIKFLGLINTIVMARILMPSDYGIVALGMLVVSLIQTFLDFGATTALLRKNSVTRDEIDSAWTLRLMQGIAIAFILFFSAPLASQYYSDSRISYILFTLSIAILLASATNIGQTLAQKEFDFKFEFRLQITSNLIRVIVTIAFGLLLGDYRALVFGIVSGYITPLVLSYAWHPYRPKWNTSKIVEIWAITKWILWANIGGFILRRSDEMVASQIGTASEFGIYNVGADFGQMPVGEVGPAIIRTLLPVLASIRDDAERVRNAVVKTLNAVNSVIWPVGIGFIAVAPQATGILLGDKWLDAIPFISAFSIIAIFQSMTGPARTLMTLLGYTREQSSIVWLEFLAFALSALYFVPTFHLLGLAFARMLSSFISAIISLVTAKLRCDLPLGKSLAALLRPAVGSILMYFVVLTFSGFVSIVYFDLVVKILVGILFYIAWSLATWMIIGRPEGLESTILEKFHRSK